MSKSAKRGSLEAKLVIAMAKAKHYTARAAQIGNALKRLDEKEKKQLDAADSLQIAHLLIDKGGFKFGWALVLDLARTDVVHLVPPAHHVSGGANALTWASEWRRYPMPDRVAKAVGWSTVSWIVIERPNVFFERTFERS